VQQATVGYLTGEGVLEGVDQVRKEPRLVEELGCLQMCESTMQCRLGQFGNRL
jgi:hypothetical protein